MRKPIIVLISGKARHGKDTLARMVQEVLPDYLLTPQVVSFADAVKREVKETYKWNGEKDDYGRNLLQSHGQMRREQDSEYWIKLTEARFYKVADVVLIPDARYTNEINYFRERGYTCLTVRVVRCNEDDSPFDNGLTSEQQSHISETDLDEFPFDIRIKRISGAKNMGQKRIADIISRLAMGDRAEDREC